MGVHHAPGTPGLAAAKLAERNANIARNKQRDALQADAAASSEQPPTPGRSKSRSRKKKSAAAAAPEAAAAALWRAYGLDETSSDES